MIRERLLLALERLKPSDWAHFEQLASAFLAAEYDELRSTADPSGDEGRDSELFGPVGEPSIVFQYSVAQDWKAKIKKTVRRVLETLPGVRALVYVTSQHVGAESDSLKREIRKEHGIALDVRDRQWFVDRVLGDSAKEAAAEELTRYIVDPLLASRGVQPRQATPLTTPEAVAAFTYLSLQWQDDVRDKGLTKLAFEALVRSVLVGTDSDHRLTRDELRSRVHALLPGHAPTQVDGYVEGALRRLEKKSIRHWTKEDEFCLTYDEVQRLGDYQVLSALADGMLNQQVRAVAVSALMPLDVPPELVETVTTAVRAAVERFLVDKSQTFALAVARGQMRSLLGHDVSDAVIKELNLRSLPRIPDVNWLTVLTVCATDVLESRDEVIQEYLRSLADGYTLFAFLRETPDVQAAVEKMFSHGSIWFDTSVLLPLLAEALDDEEGRFTRMLRAAQEAGLNLFVTEGVLEEIERHMNRSLHCARIRAREWEGAIPYLLRRFLESGQSIGAFAGWLENFRGTARPIDDLATYLQEEFGIQRRDLGKEAGLAPEPLRYALQAIWYEAHRRRREKMTRQLDEISLTRLVEHDVECYAGVVQFRTQERDSPFGYTAWWLTLDRAAFSLEPLLRDHLGGKPPDSPVISADFLVNYLAFGPVRRRVAKPTESRLPTVLDIGSARYLTPELIAEAERIRAELAGLPERVVRRRVVEEHPNSRTHEQANPRTCH